MVLWLSVVGDLRFLAVGGAVTALEVPPGRGIWVCAGLHLKRPLLAGLGPPRGCIRCSLLQGAGA